ncbi:MAG: hypothetical protein KGJ86_04445 [Chloroflexota bacterium]|nr:hypothetical protein [Chloroflexota bacterium]
MPRANGSDSTKRGGRQPSGRTRTAVRPGDRRDGQALIFGWGRHLTRAEKQRFRERLVLAGGGLVFLIVALVVGIGAFQQFYLQPRAAVATVNGAKIDRQWLQKNVAYDGFVLQNRSQQDQNQYQALIANLRATAAAAATSEAAARPKPAATGSAPASSVPGSSAAASAGGTAQPSATAQASPTFTPAPTLNPEQSATVASLGRDLTELQQQYPSTEAQTTQDLIDLELMKQQAPTFGITVSSDDLAKQSQKTMDLIGGQAGYDRLLNDAHLSKKEYDRIQYDLALKDRFRAYFADHPDKAPAPAPTPQPSPSPTTAGTPVPTPSPQPTATPQPGEDALQRWLVQTRSASKITQAPRPLPS